ncbi:hypothetical protein E3N88_04484 [Mikania micrantha]|uniref:Integrase catalytic domain-containing protein n=1 Tax=Mikania micrantha TaxID=192012 RepID=A0A5N6PWF0_9ASTR|nr:hypothetical protein E3N88_04484 [Mikania micrantha]
MAEGNNVVIHRESEPSSLVCPKLTSSNYGTWVILMEALLDAKGLWETIDPVTGDNEDPKKIKYARALIYQSLPENILAQVARTRSAKDIWEALRVRFLGATRVQQARSDVGICSKFNSLGDDLEDKVAVKRLLDAMPPRFISIVATIEQVADLSTLTFEDCISRLKAFEERIKGSEESVEKESRLLYAKTESRRNPDLNQRNHGRGRGTNNHDTRGRGRGRGRSNGRGRGRSNHGNETHKEENRPWDNQNRNRDKSNVRCYNCQTYGHFAWECPKPQQNQEANLNKVENHGNAQGQTLMMATVDDEVFLNEEKVHPKVYANDTHDSSIWYLDNGASNHMTGCSSHFSSIDKEVSGLVRFGDGSKVRIMGRGTIVFDCKNGEQRVVNDVYYIPDLCSNILSLGQMTEVGCKVWMDEDQLWLYEDGYQLMMQVQRSPNRLYKISLKIGTPVCLLSSIKDQAWLWHARLGHLNFRAINNMKSKNIVIGDLTTMQGEQVCDACMLGKQARNSFPKKSLYRANKPFELVHTDLCGPISPPTLGGNRYFMLLVDDYTRYAWVYALRTKDEALGVFKKFKNEVELEHELKVKALKSDRGGEFLNRLFAEYCDETGVKRMFTAPYSPQQNGVVERRNRTVLNSTRSMLKALKLPQNLWGEAVFGCLAHMKIPSVKVTKLDDRSQKVVHLGMEPGTKAYRLYDPFQKKVYVSRDVKFEESKTVEWENITEVAGNKVASGGIEFIVNTDQELDELTDQSTHESGPVGPQPEIDFEDQSTTNQEAGPSSAQLATHVGDTTKDIESLANDLRECRKSMCQVLNSADLEPKYKKLFDALVKMDIEDSYSLHEDNHTLIVMLSFVLAAIVAGLVGFFLFSDAQSFYYGPPPT